MYHFMSMRRAPELGAMCDRSSNGFAGQLGGGTSWRDAQRFDFRFRRDAEQLRREDRFQLRRLGKHASGFGNQKRPILQTERSDDVGGQHSQELARVREDLLRDNVTRYGGRGHQRKQLRKNAVWTLGDAPDDDLPVVGFLRKEDFFAEQRRGPDAVTRSQRGLHRTTADVVCAAIVANPRPPSTGARDLPRSIAAANRGARSCNDHHARTIAHGGAQSELNIRDDTNRRVRKCMEEIGLDAASDAWPPRARDSRANRANIFGISAGVSESTLRCFAQHVAGAGKSGTHRIRTATARFGKQTARAVDENAIRFCSARVKTEKEAH